MGFTSHAYAIHGKTTKALVAAGEIDGLSSLLARADAAGEDGAVRTLPIASGWFLGVMQGAYRFSHESKLVALWEGRGEGALELIEAHGIKLRETRYGKMIPHGYGRFDFLYKMVNGRRAPSHARTVLRTVGIKLSKDEAQSLMAVGAKHGRLFPILMQLAQKEFAAPGGDAMLTATFGQFVPEDVARDAVKQIAEWPALSGRFVVIRTY